MKPDQESVKAIGLGFQILGTLLMFGWIGKVLDDEFATKPYFLLGALVFAIVCCLYFLIRFTKNWNIYNILDFSPLIKDLVFIFTHENETLYNNNSHNAS